MFIHFIRKIRLNSVLSQSRAEFSELSQVEKAYTVLMAAQCLLTSEKGSRIYSEIMRSPMNYSPDQCYQVYCELESFKVYQEAALRKMDVQMAAMGISTNSNVLNHSKMMYTGLLFWLVRLIGFINSKKQSETSGALSFVFKNINNDDIESALKHYNRHVSFGERMNASMPETSGDMLKKAAIMILGYLV